MPTLQPHLTENPRLTVGTIAELSITLHAELQMSGYSLLLEDVRDVVLLEAANYAAWASFEQQRFINTPIQLDSTLPIDAYEWSMIEVVCRAHCDLLQAIRMEGSRSLGTENFGLAVSEARQIYQEQRDLLPKNAFIEPPYMLVMDDD